MRREAEHNYLVKGMMLGGFAMVAYPAEYGVSGIQTFIVNQSGTVYQKDLGAGTAALAAQMSRYNPDKTWSRYRGVGRHGPSFNAQARERANLAVSGCADCGRAGFPGGRGSGGAAGDGRFDGVWDTTVSCENTAGAMGYSFKFSSTVKDGLLHGGKGTQGKPGWLQIDGPIAPDGAAKLYADGLVGASEAAVGHLPAGSQYGYHIEAQFSGESGTGKRVEGRPCSVTFVRTRKR